MFREERCLLAELRMKPKRKPYPSEVRSIWGINKTRVNLHFNRMDRVFSASYRLRGSSRFYAISSQRFIDNWTEK
jgi:hypothetical protein